MPRTFSLILPWIEAQLNALVSNVGTIIPPQKSHSSDAATHQECGVGMELEKDDCQWYVAGVRPGGPAATAGVRAGDLLCAVDWKHVKGKSEYDVQRMIYGAQGTALTLELSGDDGGAHHVTVMRVMDYSPDTLAALSSDDVEYDAYLTDTTCCSLQFNRCAQPRASAHTRRDSPLQ
mmetsp:Transcript_28612/g.45984  ORF Transcript_28612/g.45984 Transcript_28612/m.45984 type:complete len:177 (+) Transcript_28612:222-752(+)|eukprot:CAMPEP_0179429450 /NCGR_PEP_ID=MMETSP0799-20121207/14818_1 /TAXON_ID=46947 /ORGANISM="Geminigera cryophila, Strain CCMP2564" /LENGTH=176 /DNA_ID=CAMNT_0021205349 /DNA_START=202 /DNA_END=732 /DNA_ORIENTATION=+